MNVGKTLMLVMCFILAGKISFAEQIIWQESFQSLDKWTPLVFNSIPKQSTYTIIHEASGPCLKASSQSSASGLTYNKMFNINQASKLSWHWKIDNVYQKGNIKEKKNDDSPIRVYAMFKYDPKKADFFTQLKYESIKLFYGQYPPHSSLTYLWANQEQSTEPISSPYTDRSKIIIKQSGSAHAGQWLVEQVNLIDDYKQAFGQNPPLEFTIGIMNDSDNTREQSVSYLDELKLSQ